MSRNQLEMKASKEKKLLYQGCKQNFLKGNQQSTAKLCRKKKITQNANNTKIWSMQLESFISSCALQRALIRTWIITMLRKKPYTWISQHENQSFLSRNTPAKREYANFSFSHAYIFGYLFPTFQLFSSKLNLVIHTCKTRRAKITYQYWWNGGEDMMVKSN